MNFLLHKKISINLLLPYSRFYGINFRQARPDQWDGYGDYGPDNNTEESVKLLVEY